VRRRKKNLKNFFFQGAISEGTIRFKVAKTIDMTIHWKALMEHFLVVPLVSRSQHTDMTIHWKALNEHFQMVPLVLRLLQHIDMTIHWKALMEHFLIVPSG
jgi:hypothetical protein